METPGKWGRSRIEAQAEAQAGRGSEAGRGRVGGRSRARGPGPEFYWILVEDVPGAGRERDTDPDPDPPDPESGGLPPHNPFAPHPPHSDKAFIDLMFCQASKGPHKAL